MFKEKNHDKLKKNSSAWTLLGRTGNNRQQNKSHETLYNKISIIHVHFVRFVPLPPLVSVILRVQTVHERKLPEIIEMSHRKWFFSVCLAICRWPIVFNYWHVTSMLNKRGGIKLLEYHLWRPEITPDKTKLCKTCT